MTSDKWVCLLINEYDTCLKCFSISCHQVGDFSRRKLFSSLMSQPQGFAEDSSNLQTVKSAIQVNYDEASTQARNIQRSQKNKNQKREKNLSKYAIEENQATHKTGPQFKKLVSTRSNMIIVIQGFDYDIISSCSKEKQIIREAAHAKGRYLKF